MVVEEVEVSRWVMVVTVTQVVVEEVDVSPWEMVEKVVVSPWGAVVTQVVVSRLAVATAGRPAPCSSCSRAPIVPAASSIPTTEAPISISKLFMLAIFFACYQY